MSCTEFTSFECAYRNFHLALNCCPGRNELITFGCVSSSATINFNCYDSDSDDDTEDMEVRCKGCCT